MRALDALYQQLILDHSKRPIGKRELAEVPGAVTASHHELNPSCGDEITLSIAVDPASGELVDLAWEGAGCSISMASASVLSQLVRDSPSMSAADAHALITAFREMIQSRGNTEFEPDEDLLGDAVAFQGVSKFVMRIKCAMLAWVALEADLKKIS